MKQHNIRAAGYLFEGLNPDCMGKVLAYLVREIEKSGIEFDTVAFRGFSGCLFGPAVAMQLKKYVAYVRKGTGQDTHSSYAVEGPAEGFRYIIVDDLVASGSTIRATIEACGQRGAECVGVFLWSQHNHGQSPMDARYIPDCPIYATDRDISDYRRWNRKAGEVEKRLADNIQAIIYANSLPSPQKLLPELCESTQRVRQISNGDIGCAIPGQYFDEITSAPDPLWWKQQLGRPPIIFKRGCDSQAAPTSDQPTKEMCCASDLNKI